MGAKRVAIVGAGNIGRAIAQGLVASGGFAPQEVALTRRRTDLLAPLAAEGFGVGGDNVAAVRGARIAVLAVEPRQADGVLEELAPLFVEGGPVFVSVVTGLHTARIREALGPRATVVRAMPNTAIALRESMTCLAAAGGGGLEEARGLFDALGRTAVIPEELMDAATALVACGVAFFLRAVRAASQGGIEIGFHADDALLMAAQTARGAASLLLSGHGHPEAEIDRVTTPRGCTIAGLNQMEHEGFSSAMIKGITVAADKASRLYRPPA